MMGAKIQVEKYFAALERLKTRGQPINNDAVAKEAGSGKGSIKKSRPGYADLIAAIEKAALEQKQAKETADPTPRLHQQIATLQQRLDNALEREVSLLYEVYELREKVRQLGKGQLYIATNSTR